MSNDIFFHPFTAPLSHHLCYSSSYKFLFLFTIEIFPHSINHYVFEFIWVVFHYFTLTLRLSLGTTPLDQQRLVILKSYLTTFLYFLTIFSTAVQLNHPLEYSFLPQQSIYAPNFTFWWNHPVWWRYRIFLQSTTKRPLMFIKILSNTPWWNSW